MRRTLTRPSGLTALVAGMLVLLPVLAFLQYRWLGQLSDADRDRIERSLRVSTTAFAQQIDLELARAYVSLQLDATTVRQRAWAGYADRYAFWRAASNEPTLVTDVFLVVPDAESSGGTRDLALVRRPAHIRSGQLASRSRRGPCSTRSGARGVRTQP